MVTRIVTRKAQQGLAKRLLQSAYLNCRANGWISSERGVRLPMLRIRLAKGRMWWAITGKPVVRTYIVDRLEYHEGSAKL